MIVRGITVSVKPEAVEDFKKESKKNREGSIREEGILRFDVLQSTDNPEEFFLYEVYVDEAATAAHKETEHYKAWKSAVETMMAGPRVGKAFTPVSPVNPEEW